MKTKLLKSSDMDIPGVFPNWVVALANFII